MLSLSKDQMQHFDGFEWERFRNELAEHLETFFPWGKAFWPDGNAQALADFGIKRARHYGFETERQITLFVNLMPVLGSRYDENPLTPWAARKLADPTIREPVHKIDQMTDMAMLHLRKTNGREGRRGLKGLKQVQAVVGTGPAPADPVRALMATFPDRARASKATPDVLSQAVAHARSFGMDTALGSYICAALTLMYGPFFYADPQLPEVHSILYDTALDSEAKTKALQAVMIKMMDALAVHVGEGV